MNRDLRESLGFSPRHSPGRDKNNSYSCKGWGVDRCCICSIIPASAGYFTYVQMMDVPADRDMMAYFDPICNCLRWRSRERFG